MGSVIINVGTRQPVYRGEIEALTVIGPQLPKRSTAQPHRLVEHRIEYRREVAWRGIDDSQDLGSRGLLLQSLARLGNESRVLHRDHCLRREVLHQRDLFLAEWSDFLAVDTKVTEYML